MNEQDAFFTHATVGAPFSVLLGRRMSSEHREAQGLALDVDSAETRLSPAWQPWAIERLADLPPGVPRRRPKRLRRWLERNALAIALLGLLALASGAFLWAQAQGWIALLLQRGPF